MINPHKILKIPKPDEDTGLKRYALKVVYVSSVCLCSVINFFVALTVFYNSVFTNEEKKHPQSVLSQARVQVLLQ